VHDTIARLVDVNAIVVDARHRVRRQQKVLVAQTNEAAGSNFEQANFALVSVDEEIAHVADRDAMLVRDVSAPDVLSVVTEHEIGITQLLEFVVRGIAERAHDVPIILVVCERLQR
jgi:hypothetical protein